MEHFLMFVVLVLLITAVSVEAYYRGLRHGRRQVTTYELHIERDAKAAAILDRVMAWLTKEGHTPMDCEYGCPLCHLEDEFAEYDRLKK